MNKEKFLAELKRQRPEKYNFSAISDLETETYNTYATILRLQSELQSYKDSVMQQYDELYSKVFDDELNTYGDMIDKLIEMGINAPDFVGHIGKQLDDSILELADLKEALNK